MARRRRRRDRREALAEPVATKSDKRVARAEEKRRSDFASQQRSLVRRQQVVGLLGFIPLAGVLGCSAGFEPFCVVPREWLLAIWAAVFGSYLGITIRLWLERRKFRRGAVDGRSA